MEAAYADARMDVRYLNCEVPPAHLADAVRGAIGMGWLGFNCSIPHKQAILEHLDELEARQARDERATSPPVSKDGSADTMDALQSIKNNLHKQKATSQHRLRELRLLFP